MKRLIASFLLTGIVFAQEPSEVAKKLLSLADMVAQKEKKLLAIKEDSLDPVNLAISHLESAKAAIERIDYPVCGKDGHINCLKVNAIVKDIESILAGLYAARSRMGSLRIVTPDIDGRKNLRMELRPHEEKLLREAQEWAD